MRSDRSGLIGGLAAVTCLVATAAAATEGASGPQDAGIEPEAVVITGSRIRGVEAVGSGVISVEREEILEAGAPTTGDLMRKIPQIIGLGASETASSAQNAAANATRSLSVNLRGIGSSATLLLLNGRRLPAAGTQGQIIDASVVPALAIDRFEVVADGGSAIYGSDAVTGVVNILTRKDFVGQETTARYGSASGGYDDYSIGHIAGFGWEGGHLMATLDYGHHAALQGRDRDFYTTDLRAQGAADLRSNQCSPGNIVVGGVSYAIPAGGVTPATVGSLTPNTRNLCDNIRLGDIIPEVERTSVLFSLEQELGAAFTLFADGFFSRREFALWDQPATANLTVTRANPFYVNPTGGTGPITVQYNFSRDGGLSRNPGFAESWQGVLGLRRELPADWQIEAYASYGESEDIVRRTTNLNNTAAGINAYLANPDPAVAFNPFSPSAGNNPATIAAVRNGQFIIQGDTSLNVYALQADGPLFEMSGGAVRLAAGAEYREEELGGLLQSGSTTLPTLVPNASSRTVKATFAEVFIPFVGAANAMRGVQRLELSVAGRYEKYSDFGDTFNPKVGLRWEPLGDLMLRASWGESFRAPGLAENDPRSGGYGLYGDTLPCNHRPPATTCFGIGIAGGNAELQPEEAETWSIGLQYSPAWLPGFSASLTWFDIDYQSQIIGLRGTAGLLTNPIYAQYRILNPTPQQIADLVNSGLPINSNINAGTVTYIQDGRRQNLGGTIARGVDFDLQQVWRLGAGDFTLGVLGSYFTELRTALAPGAPYVDVLDTVNYPQRFRVRGEAGWRRQALDAVVFVNHVGAYDQTGVTPAREIDAYTTVDLHFGFDFSALESVSAMKGLRLALDVSNLFDEEPPASYLSPGYDAQSSSPVGRVYAVSLRQSW